jgi:hypothetical protein
MPVSLTKKRQRWQIDVASYGNFIDAMTSRTPEHWVGSPLRVEIGKFFGIASADITDDDRVDVSSIQSVTVEIREEATSTTNVASKTTGALNNAMTAATWLDKTSQHAVLEFSAAEMNLPARTYHIGVTAQPLVGDPFTIGVSNFLLRADGAGLAVGDPPTNPGPVNTVAQNDARYLTLGVSRVFAVAIGNGQSSVPVVFTPAFDAVPKMQGLIVQKAAADAPDVSVMSIHSLTAAGFTAELSAAAPAGTYVLHGSARLNP